MDSDKDKTTTGAPTEPAQLSGNEERVFAVVQRLLKEADRYYNSALFGIAHLPFRCAWAISAARSVYGGIGQVVLARGPSALQQRAGLSGRQKLGKLFSSLFTALRAVLFGRRQAAPSRDGLWTASSA